MTKQQQLRKPLMTKCYRCMALGDFSLKNCVSYGINKPYPNAPSVTQYFCEQHCTITLLSQHEKTEIEYRQWIQRAIASLNSEGALYNVSQVYEKAGLQHGQIKRYPKIYEELRLQVLQAVHDNKVAIYGERIANTLEGLEDQKKLTVRKILALAKVPHHFFITHECLWAPVDHAIAVSGGQVPARGETRKAQRRTSAWLEDAS